MRPEVAGRGNEWPGQLHIFVMLIAVSISRTPPQNYRRCSDGDCNGQHNSRFSSTAVPSERSVIATSRLPHLTATASRTSRRQSNAVNAAIKKVRLRLYHRSSLLAVVRFGPLKKGGWKAAIKNARRIPRRINPCRDLHPSHPDRAETTKTAAHESLNTLGNSAEAPSIAPVCR